VEQENRERRSQETSARRRTFGELSRTALSSRVKDSRHHEARWVTAPNLAWVSWPREDHRHAYVALCRKADFITGELGTSLEPVEMDALPLLTTTDNAPASGCRVQLGSLLHGHAKTWSSGGSEKTLIERLDWLAQQLNLRLYAFMAATAPKP
jgi:hypothetical protein